MKSLESLQATLNGIKSILSASEIDFRDAVRAQAQLDDSTSSIADFHDRILRKYENTLGAQATGKAVPKMWRKLTWAFNAAKDLAEFQTPLLLQLQIVGLEMASQQSRRVQIITATTASTHETLRSLSNKSHSDHALTLNGVEDTRSHLASEVSDFRALFEMQNEHDLEARKNYHTEIKNLLRRMQAEYRQSVGGLSQMNERITKLPEDVQSQEGKWLRRGYSEQAQQLLQIQRGIDDVKALVMGVQSTITVPSATSNLENPSLASSFSLWSREVRKFILYLGASLRVSRMLILSVFHVIHNNEILLPC